MHQAHQVVHHTAVLQALGGHSHSQPVGLAFHSVSQLNSNESDFKILPGDILHYYIVLGPAEGGCTHSPMIAEKGFVEKGSLNILGAPVVCMKSEESTAS